MRYLANGDSGLDQSPDQVPPNTGTGASISAADWSCQVVSIPREWPAKDVAFAPCPRCRQDMPEFPAITQLAGTVAWHSTVTVAVGTVAGVPLGIIVGRIFVAIGGQCHRCVSGDHRTSYTNCTIARGRVMEVFNLPGWADGTATCNDETRLSTQAISYTTST